MQQHMKVCVACARKVLPFIEAMIAGDREAMTARRDDIDRLEHEADDLKNDIRAHMPSRFMMAMERHDMLEILDCQDSIADVAQDIAELAELRRMTVPEPLVEPLLALVNRVVAACDHAEQVVRELDELVETGFGDREVARVEVMLDELNRIESDTDELSDRLLREVFALEEQLGVGTAFWYQWVNWIADLADYAERVGNRLRLLIAR
jgi:predicted phosphate transport protein (TIGR00153 family)